MLRDSPAEKQICQPIQHCIMSELSSHIDPKAVSTLGSLISRNLAKVRVILVNLRLQSIDTHFLRIGIPSIFYSNLIE
jgi:hypothetical protein